MLASVYNMTWAKSDLGYDVLSTKAVIIPRLNVLQILRRGQVN